MVVFETDGLVGFGPGEPGRDDGGGFGLREPGFEFCDSARGPVEGVPAKAERRREHQHDQQGGRGDGAAHPEPAERGGAHG